jgi:hypothetical protein
MHIVQNRNSANTASSKKLPDSLPSIASSKFYHKLVLLMSMLMLSFSVNAALSIMDLRSAGDGAITYDDSSDLYWLDLTETAGMSYSQVSAQLGAGGSLEGWRYATAEEATDIYAQFGLTPGAETLPIEDFTAAVDTMNSFFGDLFDATDYAETHSGSWAISGTEWDAAYPDWHLMFVAYTYGGGESAELDLGINYSADLNMSWEYAGSLLVRDDKPVSPIPLPGALVLFPTGLFVFRLASSKRKNKQPV